MNLLVKGSYSVVFWHHPLEEDEWLLALVIPSAESGRKFHGSSRFGFSNQGESGQLDEFIS